MERGKLVAEGEGFGGVRLAEDPDLAEPPSSTNRDPEELGSREETASSETGATPRRGSVSRYRSVYLDAVEEVEREPWYGEVRTDCHYVVAPGSFVASASEEIPDAAAALEYYTIDSTVESHEIAGWRCSGWNPYDWLWT